jgi:hypothetical protein
MKKRGHYSPEVRERAVRLVFTQEAAHTSQRAAISSIARRPRVSRRRGRPPTSLLVTKSTISTGSIRRGLYLWAT